MHAEAVTEGPDVDSSSGDLDLDEVAFLLPRLHPGPLTFTLFNSLLLPLPLPLPLLPVLGKLGPLEHLFVLAMNFEGRGECSGGRCAADPRGGCERRLKQESEAASRNVEARAARFKGGGREGNESDWRRKKGSSWCEDGRCGSVEKRGGRGWRRRRRQGGTGYREYSGTKGGT
eukprot:1083037-Rhodomonas_salina.2